MKTLCAKLGRRLPFAAVLSALLLCASGCSKRADTPASGAPANDDAKTAALVKQDPVAFIETQIAALESDSLRYGEIEKSLQWELQKRRKEADAAAASKQAASEFGKKGKALLQDPSAVFPVVVDGRRFDSRNALVAELAAAKDTILREPKTLGILHNQIEKIKVRLDAIAKKRIEISGEISTLRHKADSARVLVAQGNLSELDKMVADLVDTANAALPDDEYFSPSFEDVGSVSLEEDVASFEF